MQAKDLKAELRNKTIAYDREIGEGYRSSAAISLNVPGNFATAIQTYLIVCSISCRTLPSVCAHSPRSDTCRFCS